MTEQIELSIVRIRAPDGRTVGAGFLVAEGQVLTCAHVVAAALGLPEDAPETPQARVHLDFPLVASARILTARVIHWQPKSDVAGLELDGDPPSGARPVRTRQKPSVNFRRRCWPNCAGVVGRRGEWWVVDSGLFGGLRADAEGVGPLSPTVVKRSLSRSGSGVRGE